MPGLTKKGDLTIDHNLFLSKKLQCCLNWILEDTGIIWISRVWLEDKSFEIIDVLVEHNANDFAHTYDLVIMRDKSPKNQFLDSTRNRYNEMKLNKEVPKILNRLRLKLICPFPQVLHAFTYEDWKNWRKNYDYSQGFFPQLSHNICGKNP